MRLIVCGGRTYQDINTLYQALHNLHALSPITTIIHGNATGADTLAAKWAKDNNIPAEAYPANWTLYGKAAGYIRNKLMLSKSPALVLAAPGGPGTANMIAQAKAHNIPVIYVTNNAQAP